MTTLLGISGSLRAGSYNTALLRAAAQHLPAGVTLEVATLHGIPLYDGDLEAEHGIPEAVTTLKTKIQNCDGLLLATPEYNGGVPGVFKNAIDWLSRPPSETGKVFEGRAVSILGATPGGFGTALAQNHWLPVLRALGMHPWFGGRLMVARASSVFDASGQIVDEKLQAQLSDFVQGFATFAAV